MSAYEQLIIDLKANPSHDSLLVLADWLQEQGKDELATTIRIAVTPLTQRDWREHVTVLEPTADELANHGQLVASGQEQFIGLSPALTEIVWTLRRDADCNLFHTGPQSRNWLIRETADHWRETSAGYCLRHAIEASNGEGIYRYVNALERTIKAMHAYRDFAACVGMAEVAAQIHRLIPAAVAVTLANHDANETRKAKEQAEEAELEAARREKARLAGRPLEASPQFRLTSSHRAVLAYVRNHPGCCKYDAAAAGTYDSRRCPSKLYYLVNTLIRQGYILASRTGNAYELHAWDEVMA